MALVITKTDYYEKTKMLKDLHIVLRQLINIIKINL